ncbi:MAG: hypothetical protein JW783_14330 [Bacteroidales bacterium]|nr:hypothetical protein [Bacteroidales bacterium]MBN2748385.1 hypothetical protein [Bacteroidales bacterium]
MVNKTQKQITFLMVYSGMLTVALILTIAWVIVKDPDTQFNEITVERINVVESNGDLKLVISNSQRQHSGIINGKALPQRDRQPGLIFFNAVGDECGGLVYDGNDNEAGLVLSVDQFRDDQVMQLRYVEDTKRKTRTYGLQFWEYPKENTYDQREQAFEAVKAISDKNEQREAILKMKAQGLLPEDRMFVGKKMNSDVGLFINDSTGRPRIRIYVDSENSPRIEILDEAGNIVSKN